MEYKLSATELARKVGEVLGRIRYRRDSFVVEKNGEPVARIIPVAGPSLATVAEVLDAWADAGEAEASFAADLSRVAASDQSPPHRWDS